MCGIYGIFGARLTSNECEALSKFAKKYLANRGPDGFGELNVSPTLFLGHFRLAILALGPDGAQPMESVEGNSAISYNGELYNYKELSEELYSSLPLRETSSDCRVLLDYVSKMGPEAALSEMDGMYAFAYYDKRSRELYLCRDRFGEKPLYYAIDNSRVYFSSESTLLLKKVECRNLCESACSEFVSRGFTSDLRFSKDIRSVPKGGYVRLSIDEETGAITLYDGAIKGSVGRTQRLATQTKTISAELEIGRLLEQSVSSRMITEVPIGLSLSGGLDSSVIAAYASKIQPSIKSYTVGFKDHNYDESDRAEQIASILRLDHTTIKITDCDVRRVVLDILDRPVDALGDSSIIPTALLCETASRDVKVLLGGDGGDEMFYGYNRHRYAYILKLAANPIVYKTIKKIFEVPQNKPNAPLISMLHSLLGIYFHDVTKKTANILALAGTDSFDDLYSKLVSNKSLSCFEGSVGALKSDALYGGGRFREFSLPNLTRSIREMDFRYYLPLDILRKTDLASMHYGIELRSPYLNPTLKNYVDGLPLSKLIRGGIGKIPLTNLFKSLIPGIEIDRRKKGFSVPLAKWLTTCLEDLWRAVDLDTFREVGLDSRLCEQFKEILHRFSSGDHEYAPAVYNIVVMENFFKKC